MGRITEKSWGAAALVGMRRTVRGSEKQGSKEAWVQSDLELRPT